jgi:hypothetical protein
MTEDFLHFVWKRQMFDASDWYADTGEKVEVLHPGMHNFDSGPDFSHARIRIGGQVWVGNVEIHQRLSDWDDHRHGSDAAYDSIILHVVYEQDVLSLENVKHAFPTVSLQGRIREAHYDSYLHLMQSPSKYPCANLISSVDVSLKSMMLDRMLVEKLEYRHWDIMRSRSGNDWEETMYQQIARSLGLKINSDPMLWLARCVPFRLATRYRNDIEQVEALLLGSSGLLEREDIQVDEKLLHYRSEFAHLKHKHQIDALPHLVWKFFRLRPPSFPYVRIAQLAALIAARPLFFEQLKAAERIEELQDFFQVEASEYWSTHYLPGKHSPKASNKIGQTTIDRILINGVLPVLFSFAMTHKNFDLKEKVLSFYHDLHAEQNSVTRIFASSGFELKTAGQSQGLLHLFKNYCSPKKCLQCQVGQSLLEPKDTSASTGS